MIDLLLRNARIEGTEELLDVAVDGGQIVDRGPALAFPSRQELDAGGRLLVPGFVEGHVHLDIALVISLLKEAEVSVISLPDLYRLGRTDPHSVRRGLTRVKELLAAGVNVTYASNNVRDALRPLGNLDPLEEGLILAYGAHMDTVDELTTIMRMSTYHGARALKLKDYGLEPGCQADMVVLDAPSASAAIVNQAEKRFVFKAGRLVAANESWSTLLNGAARLPSAFPLNRDEKRRPG